MQFYADMVSIVVPIYNMEKHLKRCVSSIMNQTYKNFEVILVDDGSDDNSREICRQFKLTDNRVNVILKENGGVSTARNTGLAVAKGDWVMFVDPDDFLNETIIERLLASCSNETDIVMCTCTAMIEDRHITCHFFNGNRVFANNKEKKELYKQLMDMKYGQVGEKIYTAVGVPWGKLYRMVMLKKNNITFNSELRRVQDNIFNTYAFTYAREIKYIDSPLYMYSYEHMASYFDQYRNNYAEIFLEVRKAKYQCMKSLGLLNEKDLYKYYVNETIVNQASILKYGIFHPKNPIPIPEKIKLSEKVSRLECFSIYMNFYGFSMINSIKYKMFWLLILLKMYRLICIISKIKFNQSRGVFDGR